MKEEKVAKHDNKKEQIAGQQATNSEAQTPNSQRNATDDKNDERHLRDGENENARSGNNDTVGIP